MNNIKCKGKWANELFSVLCGIRTTVSRFTERTPFSLMYEAEAVLPRSRATLLPHRKLASSEPAHERNDHHRQDEPNHIKTTTLPGTKHWQRTSPMGNVPPASTTLGSDPKPSFKVTSSSRRSLTPSFKASCS